MALEHHPDKGGDDDYMVQLCKARDILLGCDDYKDIKLNRVNYENKIEAHRYLANEYRDLADKCKERINEYKERINEYKDHTNKWKKPNYTTKSGDNDESFEEIPAL